MVVMALVIGEDQRRLIREALQMARENPVTAEDVARYSVDNIPGGARGTLHLRDRPADLEPRETSKSVMFPGGVRAAIAFEEQPVGLVKHLSVSSPLPGTIPTIEVFALIMDAFGMDAGREFRSWFEEFEPGHYALNAVQLAEEDVDAEAGG